jgi:hypothetical protein
VPSSLLVPGGRPEPDPEDVTVTPEPAEPIECTTAFVVYQLPDGLWQVSTDIDVPLIPQREAHGDDLTSGCSTTLRDVQTRETAQAILNSDFGPAIVSSTTQSVIANMGMIGQQMVKAKEEAAVTQQLQRDQQRRGGR